MRAKVIQSGGQILGDLALNSLVAGAPNQNTLKYINDNLVKTLNTVKHVSEDYKKELQGFINLNSSNVLQQEVKRVINNVDHIANETSIIGIGYHNFDRINNRMRQVVMSHPKVASMYRDNLICGFNGVVSPFELDNQSKVKETYEYSKNINGYHDDFVIRSEDSWEGIWYADELDEMDRSNIISTYEIVDNMLENNLDPTSLNLEKL